MEDETMEIQKGVPMPTQKYPLDDMDIGDSIFFDSDTKRHQLDNAVQRVRYRTGRKFTIRKVDGGFRLWRVE
jgi:hypothetical protein